MNHHKRSYYKPRPLHTVTTKKRSPSFNSSVTSGNITSDEEKYMNYKNEEKYCFYRKGSHHVLKIMQDGQILEEDLRKIEEKGNFCASELTVAPNVKKISLPGFL